jgi:hypothetical protein
MGLCFWSGEVTVTIHTNMNLHNQVQTASWLNCGLVRKGIDCVITPDKTADGDIHIIQGPHYCYQDWIGKPDVLWLNRTFYGDSVFNISLGWLNADGSRDFYNKDMAEPKGTLPELKPIKTQQEHAVIFADYGQMNQARHWEVDAREKYQQVYVRAHPADQMCYYTLEDLWQRCDAAIGGQSTVLVDAVINGLHTISTDPLHVVQGMTDRQQWLTDLSWAQWNHTELMNGDWIEHLC